MITFTLDLEDYWLRGDGQVPLDRSVDRILDAAASAGAVGTVFVVGELARHRPDLVRRCRAAGHEVALHGYRHVALDALGPAGFREDVERGAGVLSDITGEPVVGYRAPLFSLTPRTAWAPGILADLGFLYSSSVLPARNPIHGWPGAPRSAFAWPSGLIEFPCPLGGVGPLAIPYLGGVYLRYLPMPLVRRLAAASPQGRPLWLYCHPYDVDDTGRALTLPHAGRLTTWILGRRRRGTPSRIAGVLSASGPGRPLGTLAAGSARLRVFPVDSALV